MIGKDYVKSDPLFFRMITYSGIGLAILIFISAIFFEAHLDVKADMNTPPNPAKASWFLIWIQEIVSYSAYMIYFVIALFAYYCLLPHLYKKNIPQYAIWFDKSFRLVQIITLLSFLFIVSLTIIAILFRGKNWELIFYL